jgi:hypothetical protein
LHKFAFKKFTEATDRPAAWGEDNRRQGANVREVKGERRVRHKVKGVFLELLANRGNHLQHFLRKAVPLDDPGDGVAGGKKGKHKVRVVVGEDVFQRKNLWKMKHKHFGSVLHDDPFSRAAQGRMGRGRSSSSSSSRRRRKRSVVAVVVAAVAVVRAVAAALGQCFPSFGYAFSIVFAFAVNQRQPAHLCRNPLGCGRSALDAVLPTPVERFPIDSVLFWFLKHNKRRKFTFIKLGNVFLRKTIEFNSQHCGGGEGMDRLREKAE